MSCRIALTERHARVTPCADAQRSLVAAAQRARNRGERTSASRARCPGPVWQRLVSPPMSSSSCSPSTMHAPVSSAASTASFMISASSDGVVGANAHHAFSGETRSPRITTRSRRVNLGLPSANVASPARTSCRLNIDRSPRHWPTIVSILFCLFYCSFLKTFTSFFKPKKSSFFTSPFSGGPRPTRRHRRARRRGRRRSRPRSCSPKAAGPRRPLPRAS